MDSGTDGILMTDTHVQTHVAASQSSEHVLEVVAAQSGTISSCKCR